MLRMSDEELKDIESLGIPKLTAFAELASKQFTCSHCGKCTRKCEVLYGPQLDMGEVERVYMEVMSLPEEERKDATLERMMENYPMYNALRQCCFCGYCTSACGNHVSAVDVMRAWRELFMECGLMPPEASKLVMVDNEWNIFSAYRAIYNIGYTDMISLDQAAEQPGLVDTLFFPGCSLVSYAPEVVRAIGKWLDGCGVKWALSEACCGSPLMSAGMFERACNLRHGVVEKMRKAGIKRMVTVCPGCADEFREDLFGEIEQVPLPELMLDEAQKREDEGFSAGFNPLNLDSITFFDSCHDRDDMRNANALRRLFAMYMPEAKQLEISHDKKDTLCCGAGGAVSSYDAAISDRRVWRVIDEVKATGAEAVVTMCPTCSYTIAQACLANPDKGIRCFHYAEALFGVEIDWDIVFYQLNAMWTGEYGPWLNQTFF